MTTSDLHSRRAMTLVELMVVVAIVGLLAVAIGPLFQTGSARRKNAEAAGIVSAHFNAVIARSIGSNQGEGAWLAVAPESESVVTRLAFTRPRPSVTGDGLRVSNPTSTMATVDFGPTPPSPATGVLHVAGYPTPYLLFSATEIRFLPGYSAENAAFPAELPPASGYRFWASIPPRERITASARELGGDFCIDLHDSTIGVYGYSPTVTGLRVDGSGAQPTATVVHPVEIFTVIFDTTGRATTAWTFNGENWRWHPLDATRPIALLIGNRSRAGLDIVDTPTDDDPGSNLQNPNAMWVIIDPRATMVRTVANRAVENRQIQSPWAYAQTFVREALTAIAP